MEFLSEYVRRQRGGYRKDPDTEAGLRARAGKRARPRAGSGAPAGKRTGTGLIRSCGSYGLAQYQGVTTAIFVPSVSGQGLEAAMQYLTARYGSQAAAVSQMTALLTHGRAELGQEGFRLVRDDGTAGPVPLPAAQQPPAPPPRRRPVLPPGTARGYGGMPGFAGRGVLPEEDPPELAGEIPDVYGTVRGYRWWTLDAPPLHESPARADEVWPRKPLCGMQAAWQPGENIARCLAGYSIHPYARIPEPSCGCGFWAYWELQRHETGSPKLPVCGVIEGYGAVLIGEKGFRAARARIVALHLPFTIQAATEAGDDPLGLGLPPVTRGGKVHSMPGWDPDTGRRTDPREGTLPVPALDEPSTEERQAARDKAEAWMAVIGDRLEQMYPGARVFETRAAMEAAYPPDLSYLPDAGACACAQMYPPVYAGRAWHKLGCPQYGI